MAYRIVAIPTALSNLQSHALLAGQASKVRYFVQLRSSWQHFNWQRVARSLCRRLVADSLSIGVNPLVYTGLSTYVDTPEFLPSSVDVRKKSCIGQKMQNIMCKCAKSLIFLETLSPTPDSYRRFAREPHWGTSDPHFPYLKTPLSYIESLCFSLRLCFSNVCSAPNTWRTRNQRHEFMAGWLWQKFWS